MNVRNKPNNLLAVFSFIAIHLVFLDGDAGGWQKGPVNIIILLRFKERKGFILSCHTTTYDVAPTQTQLLPPRCDLGWVMCDWQALPPHSVDLCMYRWTAKRHTITFWTSGAGWEKSQYSQSSLVYWILSFYIQSAPTSSPEQDATHCTQAGRWRYKSRVFSPKPAKHSRHYPPS